MYGILKISVAVFSNGGNDRINNRQVSLYTRRCSAEESRLFAREWVEMNSGVFNARCLDIVFSPGSIQINIDELK